MRYLKSYKIFESLLGISNNIDKDLTSKIETLVKPDSSILEISCGNAADAIQLSKDGYDVICTDMDSEYVKHASEYVKAITHDTKKPFPFKENQFNLVYSRLGLHYFNEEELVGIFKEISRITSRYLVFTVKLVNDIQTGKVILTEDIWIDLTSKNFDIISSEVKEGILYDNQSKWLEIVAEKKSKALNESSYKVLNVILQALEDIAEFKDESTYNVGKKYHNIKHYEYNVSDIDPQVLSKEISRIRRKLDEYGDSLMYIIDDSDRLFIAITPKALEQDANNFNYPTIDDLRTVDNVKSSFRFENGNDILVWYLPNSIHHQMLDTTEDYEIEDSLNDSMWRTNSPLLVTLCMWDNHLTKKEWYDSDPWSAK